MSRVAPSTPGTLTAYRQSVGVDTRRTAPASPTLAQRLAAAPRVELTLAEHLPDGTTRQHVFTVAPTSVQHAQDGSIASVRLSLPMCSYCVHRATSGRLAPQPLTFWQRLAHALTS